MAFAWTVFNYRDLVEHLHGPIARLIESWGQPGRERFMIQIPREAFKTSLCTRANALWQLCRDPDAPVCIFNERLENVQKWIRAIREVISSNNLFKEVFRDLLPPGIYSGQSPPRGWKWSDTELLLQRGAVGLPEASLTGMGIEAASTGGHWPKIIKDDLISRKAADSPSVMSSAKEWFDTSLYLERPALQGWDLIVCTRWLYGDLYDTVARKYDYPVYRRSALEDGKSIFPEKWSTEELLKQQARDPYGFASQMMNLPRPGKEQSFDLNWLRWGGVDGDTFIVEREFYTKDVPHIIDGSEPHVRIPLKSMNKCLILDPAPSEETQKRKEPGARSAIIVLGQDCWGRKYILDVWADRVDPLDVIHQILRLSDKWGTNLVGIEEVAAQLVYRHWLIQEARRVSKHVRCVKLEPKRMDKDTRITSMIPACRANSWYVNRSTATTQMFLQEYLEYPYSQTRDIIDAWAYEKQMPFHRPQSAEELWLIEAENQESTRDPITGY